MLKYNGKGFLPGIPARDLEDEELDAYGGEEYLLETGLYEKPGGDKPIRMTRRKKDETTLTLDNFSTPAVKDEEGE